jgi:WXG100 family type VII secretion target
MSDRIQVDTPLLRQVARRFEGASAEGSDTLAQLDGRMERLRADWEGVRAERFFQAYTEWAVEMRRTIEDLAAVGRQLHDIAHRFEQADGMMELH